MNVVYKIECKTTGKFYVGSSVNIKKRWYEHKRKLRNNEHPNPHLQSAWNKHGEPAFSFHVLATVDSADEMLKLEQEHIDQHKNKDYFFNTSVSVVSPRLGRPVTEETKSKLRMYAKENHWNWGKKLRPETIEKIKEKNRLRPPGYFRHTEEAKRKIGEASKGRLHTTESKRKLSEANKGKIIPQEMRDRISRALSGANHIYYGKKRDESFCEQVSRAIILMRDGEISHRFKSIKEAALDLGVFPPTLNRSLKNKKPISKGRLAGYMAIYTADLTTQNPHGIRQSTQNSSFAVTGDHNLKD